MFLLGILAFLQITFLPGFLVLIFFKLNRIRVLFILTHSFAFSLGINYLLVLGLTLFGIYTAPVMYMIIAAELIVVLVFLIRALQNSAALERITSEIRRNMLTMTGGPVVYKLLLMLTALTVCYYVYLFIQNIGTVFLHWNSLASWNRWALDWAGNHLPRFTWHFPQVVPANWSLTYVIMNTGRIQQFAKAVMPLFPLMLVLFWADRGIEHASPLYLLVSIFSGFTLRLIFPPDFLTGGFADIAVTFFTCLAVFYFLEAVSRKLERRYLLFSLIFANTAALTKQTGTYSLVVISCGLVYYLINHRKKISYKKKIEVIISAGVIMLLTTGAWYAYKEVQIIRGFDSSELMNISSDINFSFTNIIAEIGELIRRALEYKKSFSYRVSLVLGLFFLIMGLRHPQPGKLTLFFTAPYLLIWAFTFNANFQNLAVIIPLLSFTGAHGIRIFFQNVLKKKSSFFGYSPHMKDVPPPLPQQFNTFLLKVRLVYLFIILTVFLFIINFFTLPDKKLMAIEQQELMNVGDRELNQALYSFHRDKPVNGKIITGYQYLMFLPDLKKHYLSLSQFDGAELIRLIHETNAEYILWGPWWVSAAEVKSNLTASGVITDCFSVRGYNYSRVRNGRQ